MSFPESVAIEALTLCGRYCCICHILCGTKIELHHIEQKAYGGNDSLDNCIPLCFNCHADMGKADPNHPKGKRYSKEELKRHRDNWYKKVSNGIYLANDDKTAVYKEDIDLFQSICGLFTSDVKYWLSENDIGGSHPNKVFQGISNYLYSPSDPFSEFIDPELENLRDNLVSAISSFLKYKSTNTFVRDIGNESYCVTRQWMVNHEDWVPSSMDYEEYSVQYAKEAQKLNDLATELWETYCEFAKQGRLRLAQTHTEQIAKATYSMTKEVH